MRIKKKMRREETGDRKRETVPYKFRRARNGGIDSRPKTPNSIGRGWKDGA
jgi:hypothetical protein